MGPERIDADALRRFDLGACRMRTVEAAPVYVAFRARQRTLMRPKNNVTTCSARSRPQTLTPKTDKEGAESFLGFVSRSSSHRCQLPMLVLHSSFLDS